MRRRLLAIVPFVALLATTACGSSTTGGSDASASTAAGAAAVGDGAGLPAVTGEAGKKPAIAKPSGKPVTKLEVKVVTPGTGATLANGDSIVVNYLGMTWAGKEFDNSFDRGAPFSVELGAGQVIPGWDQGLVGQKVGSRLLLGIPPDLAYGAQGAGTDIGPNETLLFVVDVVSSFAVGAKATGTAVPLDDPALPKVTGDGADLAVVVPATPPPTQLVVKTLVQGTGPAVVAGQNITVQYLGVLWDGGKTFDSSWSRGGKPVSFAIGAGQGHPRLGRGDRGREDRQPGAAGAAVRQGLRRRGPAADHPGQGDPGVRRRHPRCRLIHPERPGPALSWGRPSLAKASC